MAYVWTLHVNGPLETEMGQKKKSQNPGSTVLTVTALRIIIYYRNDSILLQKKLKTPVLYKFDKAVCNRINREVQNHCGKRTRTKGEKFLLGNMKYQVDYSEYSDRDYDVKIVSKWQQLKPH